MFDISPCLYDTLCILCTLYAFFMHYFGSADSYIALNLGAFLALISLFYGISPAFYDTFWGVFCHFLFFGIFKGVRGRTYVRFTFPVPVTKRRISLFPVIRSLQLVENAQNTMFPGIGGSTIYTGECCKIKAFRDFTLQLFVKENFFP